MQEWHPGDHEDEDWYQDEFESRRRVAIFYTFINRVDYRHALPIFHITSTCLGRGLCVARNAEPTVTKEKPRPLSGVAEINASLLRVLSRRHIEYIRDDRRSSRWDIR